MRAGKQGRRKRGLLAELRHLPGHREATKYAANALFCKILYAQMAHTRLDGDVFRPGFWTIRVIAVMHQYHPRRSSGRDLIDRRPDYLI